jgi:P27 family predicted phage terminase small subunit
MRFADATSEAQKSGFEICWRWAPRALVPAGWKIFPENNSTLRCRPNVGQPMSGPPPQPISLRILRGNPSKRRLHRGLEPERPSELPEPPSFLVGYAADEWYRIAPALHQLGLLTGLDAMPLAAYCEAYATWRTAIETYNSMAERDGATRGLLIKRTTGDPARNPLLKIATDAAADMVRYAGEFGFSPAARARIAGVAYEPGPAKFDGLLAE